MKRINYLAFVMLLGLSVIFTGCDDDGAVEPAATNVNITTSTEGADGNNLPNGIISYDYSVVVMSVSGCGSGKTQGLNDVTVEVNGESKTTNSNGTVSFEGLKSGFALVSVSKPGYADMQMTVKLQPANGTPGSDVDVSYNATTTVAMFETSSSLSGKVSAPWAGPGTASVTNFPANYQAKMLLTYDINATQYNSRYNAGITPNDPGSIVNISFSESTEDQIITPTNGRFTIDNIMTIPSAGGTGLQSGITAKLELEEVTVNSNPAYRVFAAPVTLNAGSIGCKSTYPTTISGTAVAI